MIFDKLKRSTVRRTLSQIVHGQGEGTGQGSHVRDRYAMEISTRRASSVSVISRSSR